MELIMSSRMGRGESARRRTVRQSPEKYRKLIRLPKAKQKISIKGETMSFYLSS
jgi:hypothetical protein